MIRCVRQHGDDVRERMMLAEGAMIGNAAYAVGYESVPQFHRGIRAYVRHVACSGKKAAKDRMQAAA
jgi:AraC-like DNA-binding protein